MIKSFSHKLPLSLKTLVLGVAFFAGVYFVFLDVARRLQYYFLVNFQIKLDFVSIILDFDFRVVILIFVFLFSLFLLFILDISLFSLSHISVVINIYIQVRNKWCLLWLILFCLAHTKMRIQLKEKKIIYQILKRKSFAFKTYGQFLPKNSSKLTFVIQNSRFRGLRGSTAEALKPLNLR